MAADPSIRRILEHNRTMARATADAARLLNVEGETFREVENGFALYAGENSPLNFAAGSLSRVNIAELAGLYSERTKSWSAYVTPFDGHHALDTIVAVGGRFEGWENNLFRTLDDLPALNLPLGVTIEVVDELEPWSETSRRAFWDDWNSEIPIHLDRVTAAIVGNRRYLARVDGEIAAAATLFLADGVAFLGGMSTLKPFRRRGLQATLLSRRLHDAAEAADLAWLGADPGGSSQRNAERAGFQVAFTQLNLKVATAKVPTGASLLDGQ